MKMYLFLQVNLRSCNDEMRKYMGDAKQEMDSQKHALRRADMQKVMTLTM